MNENMMIEYKNMEEAFSDFRKEEYKILNPSIYNRDRKEKSIPKFFKVIKIFKKLLEFPK
jgi:hypothetical protein